MTTETIIVNYGTADLAIRAAESARAAGTMVHLVDNASPPPDADRLVAAHANRGWGDSVRLWLSKENLGFGRGNNLVLEALAAEEALPRYVLLLNPDACLKDGAVDALVAALEADSRAGAAGAALFSPDGEPQVSSFRFPTPLRTLLKTINFGPLDRLFGIEHGPLPAGRVDWVSGAALMLRMEALREVGFFDAGFFLYFEEVELMHRLKCAGYHTLYVPEARVLHAEGAATGGGGRRRQQPAYLYDSWRHYYLRTTGCPVALLTALLMLPAAALNVLHRRIRGQEATIPEGFFRQHWSRVIRPLLIPGPQR